MAVVCITTKSAIAMVAAGAPGALVLRGANQIEAALVRPEDAPAHSTLRGLLGYAAALAVGTIVPLGCIAVTLTDRGEPYREAAVAGGLVLGVLVAYELLDAIRGSELSA